MTYILFNPLANNKQGTLNAQKLNNILKDKQIKHVDFTALDSFDAFIDGLNEGDEVVLAGGDGTLNRFVNMLGDREPKNDIFYFPTGSGNDFMKDVADKTENGIVRINDYIKNLPTVTVNGVEHRFINGIGYGIDGYCCEVGDAMQAKSDATVNYTSIAIKGLLFHFKCPNAKVTVDGNEYSFKRVWLAPTMNGRYYGGGMEVAPAQDRLNPDHTVSTVVMYGSGKLKTLMVFPTIFKGEHVKHEEMISVMTGHEITVEFDKPTALQIDGETVLGVTSYSVKTKVPATV